MPWSSFFECWVLSQFFHSPFSPSSRGCILRNGIVPHGRLQRCLYQSLSQLSCIGRRILYHWATSYIFSSVQFSCSVVTGSLRPHESQHARPSCPSPTPRVYPNPCPLSWWRHPTISSSVVPFSSCLQSFSASGSFQMSQLFTSGGQSIGVSASTSVLPKNTQD